MPVWFSVISSLRALRRYDRRRPGVPGEHWAAFGAAVTLLGAARGLRSPWLRAAAIAAGGVLVVRALSGRDGAVQVVKDAVSDRP